MFTILVLVSGRGSNFLNLIKSSAGYKVEAVLTDNPNAYALTYAAQHSVKSYVVDAKKYPTKKEFRAALLAQVKELNFDLCCLAGFMQILDTEFVQSFYGRLINIHPSLLPALPGLHTHERALNEGHKIHGCSVHFVDTGVDSGPLIAQASVNVLAEDDVNSLSERVLKKEHLLYPWVVKKLSLREISLKDRTVTFSKKARLEGQDLGFIIP